MNTKKTPGIEVAAIPLHGTASQKFTRKPGRPQAFGLCVLLAALLLWPPATVFGQRADLMLTQEERDSNSKEWAFFTAAYGWLAGVDGTVAVGPLTEFPVDVPFGDLIKNVDVAFSLHVEARQSRGWTVLGDVFFADLGTTGMLPESQTELTLDQRQTIVEGAIGYSLARKWEILAAVRYNDLTVSALTPTNETDERGASWLDAFGGVRFTSLAEKWIFSGRADMGAGGSSFAWFANAGVAYALSELIWLSAGYRALSVDFEDGSGRDRVIWDMVTHGIYVGVMLTP